MKEKISITISDEAALKLGEFLRSSQHKSKSEAIETAIKRFLEETCTTN
ncbi:MAG: hypothetical protein ABIH34_07070 [Nanoarchaeota archaeon]